SLAAAASCGCTPTVANTFARASASSTAARAAPKSLPTPIDTNAPTPAASARTSTSPGPFGKYAGSRWQWESISISSVDELGVAPSNERRSRVSRAVVAVAVDLLQAIGGGAGDRLALFVHAGELLGQDQHDVAREERDLFAALGEDGVAQLLRLHAEDGCV